MKKESIVIIGGGGHAKVMIDLVENLKIYKIVGLVDQALKKGSRLLSVEVLGGDEVLPKLFKKGVRLAVLGVGSWGDHKLRDQIYARVKFLGFKFPALIHPEATVSKYATLSDGVQLMAKSCIGPAATIGENSVVNTATIVEHDCFLGRNVYTGSSVIFSGNVTVNEGTFIGSGVCIIPKVVIGKQCLIAAGAVVVSDVKDFEKVKGVPARSY